MIYKPFTKFLKEEDEKLETVNHLPHIGELLYTGDPHRALTHLDANHKMLSGQKVEGHNLSYKADGKVSIVFGKRDGVPFVKYKGSGSPELTSVADIDNHINETGKTHLQEPFHYGFQAAQHPNVGHNSSYQGDVLVPNDDNPTTFKGNIIAYKKPRANMTHGIAVHTHMDTKTGKRIAANPDVSFLETSGAHFPKLGLSDKKFNMTPEESQHITGQIESARHILSDPAVAHIANEIAQHRDPTNKLGHRHIHMVSFSNKVQRGEQKRDIASLMNWTQQAIDGTKGKQQERLKGHLDYIERNKDHIQKLMTAHSHIDAARSKIVDVIHKLPDLPMTPHDGHSSGEGFVSELPDAGQVKLVPTTFTVANFQNKERFKK
jgi:hypothetical protein